LIIRVSFAYIRLHGRNYQKWFSSNSRDERYDFLYEGERLERVKTRIEEMSKEAGKTFVLANNHPKGKAAANALELKSMLNKTKVKIPEILAAAYPNLGDVSL
jgi:uncharacterized protein YecE (DUF72 family)